MWEEDGQNDTSAGTLKFVKELIRIPHVRGVCPNLWTLEALCSGMATCVGNTAVWWPGMHITHVGWATTAENELYCV